MSSSDHPAVLVVGAGPAGLITALALNKNGVPTRIIERRESFHGGIRGTFIQPRSIELLASLGVLDEVLKISVPPYTIGVHGAGKEILSEMKWAEEADESPGTPYRCGFNVNQSVFERVLREQLEKQSIAVETDVDLVGIERSASVARACLLVDGIQREEEFDYIVAADGAKELTFEWRRSSMLDGYFWLVLNIAWKVALVHKGLAYPSLLDTYEVERVPVIAEMLAMTSNLHKLAFASSSSVSALGEHNADVSAGQKVDHMFRPKTGLQLGVNCRWSPIVLDRRDTGAGQATLVQNPYGRDSDVLRAGDRAPDAPGLLEQPGGREARLFTVTAGCTQHAVLVFSGAAPAEDVKAAIVGLDRYRRGGIASVVVIAPQGSVMPACAGAQVFIDGAGHAYGGYQIDPRSLVFVVVRPDGIIGAFATGLEQMHKYFSAILL
ncbi:hypothetical protein EWM64_g2228 [Hericium alpestre]|uniref:FAD-binding domain-containing protein n=1 Tax=Hericium alpestre TaxID=135208 RepID=A0A4Z0A611_9AGAM|nr:hypothetical protein EWM64_g2228 [Hericium alpestre]